MLNTIRRLPSPIIQICKRCKSSVAVSSPDEESIADKWQLFVSACISRPPFVTHPLAGLEQKMKDVTVDNEIEQSYESDHELRMLEDKVRAKMLKDPVKIDDKLVAEIVLQTASEYEDACSKEFGKFQFSQIVTEEDKKGDINSLHRALDKSLVLVSLQQLGKNKAYMLPQTTWEEGESLRETCDRLIKEKVNNDLNVQIFGNAPCGFYNYKYSKALREHVGFIGAKIFFFSGHVMNMDLVKLQDIRHEENLWLTHDQLGDKLVRAYHSAVKHFLISDN